MAAKKKKKNNTDIVKELTKKLLKLMGTTAKIDVKEDKENDALMISIEAKEEAGLLIGTRGDTLNSIQAILGMMLQKKTGEWQRVIVNISDWREKQEKRLSDLAVQTAERAKETNEPQTLYNLNSAQRRIVHMVLAEDNQVETESEGEDTERYLIVRPKLK